MTEEKATANDNPEAAPESKPIIQFAEENAHEGPEAQATGEEDATPPLYLGKFKSAEDMANAYQAMERKMHEATEKSATLEKLIESLPGRMPAAQPQQAPVDTESINEKFREQLSTDTWGALSAFFEHKYAERERQKMEQQNAMMQAYQRFASDPTFADVAPAVMQSLAVNPRQDLEKVFYKAKLDALTSQQNGKTTANAQREAMAGRMHVESGQTRAQEQPLTIQIDPKARRLQQAFRMNDEQLQNLAIRHAQSQIAGGSPENVADWQKMRGAKNG